MPIFLFMSPGVGSLMKAQHKHQEKDLQSAEGVEEKPVLLLLGSTPKQIRDFSAYLSFLSP